MEAATWMPAIVAGITAAAPVVGMLLKAGYSKRKIDVMQDQKIERISRAIELLESGRNENAEGIHAIRETLCSTHQDIKSLAAELRKHGVALAKQAFYAESMSPLERLLGGLSYICDYTENGQTSRAVRDFAEKHPGDLEAIFKFHPEYRRQYERQTKTAPYHSSGVLKSRKRKKEGKA